jgi:tetratricopeptide (TPR) repeat protein
MFNFFKSKSKTPTTTNTITSNPQTTSNPQSEDATSVVNTTPTITSVDASGLNTYIEANNSVRDLNLKSADLIKAGQFDEVVSTFTTTINIKETKFGDSASPFSTIVTVSHLGYAYLKLKAYEKAEPQFERVYDYQLKNPGETPLQQLCTLNNLANIYQKLGKVQKAESAFKEVLAGKKAIFGETKDVISAYNNVAYSLCEQKKFKEAHDYFSAAAAISGADSATTERIANNLAYADKHLAQ